MMRSEALRFCSGGTGVGGGSLGCQGPEASGPRPAHQTVTRWQPVPAAGSIGTRKWVFGDIGTNLREAESKLFSMTPSRTKTRLIANSLFMTVQCFHVRRLPPVFLSNFLPSENICEREQERHSCRGPSNRHTQR